jgi:Ankyrin repeat
VPQKQYQNGVVQAANCVENWKVRLGENGTMMMRAMKVLVIMVGTIALAAGALQMAPSSAFQSSHYSKDDIDLFWRESEGPNGERDPAAMPLYQAIMAQDRNQVERLLERGTSPNISLYARQFSPLMVALSFNDRPMVELLLKHGADPNFISDDQIYTTPLAVAMSSARAEAIMNGSGVSEYSLFRFLIDSGADINLKFKGEDIAIYAAGSGAMKVVNELLGRGYRRDLPGLRKAIGFVAANNDDQLELHKALATIDHLLRR